MDTRRASVRTSGAPSWLPRAPGAAIPQSQAATTRAFLSVLTRKGRGARTASDAGDAVDLHEGVARNSPRRGDRGPDAGLRPEAAQKHLVHRLVVLEVGQIHVDLQDLLHRGADSLELLLHLLEDVLRVGLDVPLEVGADAREEDEVSVRDDGAEERRLLGPRPAVPVDLLRGRGIRWLLLLLGPEGRDRGSRHGHCGYLREEISPIGLRHCHLPYASQLGSPVFV